MPQNINSFPIIAKPVSENPIATGLVDGNEILPIVQNSINKQISANNFYDLYKKQADLLGFFEYSVSSTYIIGSLVRQSGTSNIYKSLANGNLANPLTDTTKWQLCGDLSNLLKIPTTYKTVDTQADFGVASGGEIVLTSNITYIINSTILLSNTLIVPPGGNINIISAAFTKAIVQTAAIPLIKITSNFGFFTTREIIFQSPNGTLLDIAQVSGQFVNTSTIFANAVNGGTVKCALFTLFFGQFTGIRNGFIFENNASQVSFSHTSNTSWQNVGTTMFTFKGNIPDIAILDSRFVPTSLDSVYDFQSSLETFGTNILVNSTTGYPFGAGQVFAPNSLKQDYRRSFFSGNYGITESTIGGQIAFSNSALVTDIITTNTRAIINCEFQTQLTERILLVDHCTFDATANTITARQIDNTGTFNHGLVNGNKIKFKTAGTLPPEILPDTIYYVISATATTFQISATLGGSLIDFSTNGTGTQYFLHANGVNRASWILYDGITQEKLEIKGDISCLASSGTGDRVVFSSVAKLDVNFNILADLDLFGKGSNTTIDNLIASTTSINSQVSLLPQESFRFFITNRTDNGDITVQDASITIKKI